MFLPDMIETKTIDDRWYADFKGPIEKRNNVLLSRPLKKHETFYECQEWMLLYFINSILVIIVRL